MVSSSLEIKLQDAFHLGTEIIGTKVLDIGKSMMSLVAVGRAAAGTLRKWSHNIADGHRKEKETEDAHTPERKRKKRLRSSGI